MDLQEERDALLFYAEHIPAFSACDRHAEDSVFEAGFTQAVLSDMTARFPHARAWLNAAVLRLHGSWDALEGHYRDDPDLHWAELSRLGYEALMLVTGAPCGHPDVFIPMLPVASGTTPEEAAAVDARAFCCAIDDGVVARGCSLSEACGLPVLLRGAVSARLVTECVEEYPAARFIIEVTDKASAVAAGRDFASSESVSLCLKPLHNANIVTALGAMLDVLPDARRILWASDSKTPEGAVAALMAWREACATVLADLMVRGDISREEAEERMRRLMHANAREVFTGGRIPD